VLRSDAIVRESPIVLPAAGEKARGKRERGGVEAFKEGLDVIAFHRRSEHEEQRIDSSGSAGRQRELHNRDLAALVHQRLGIHVAKSRPYDGSSHDGYSP
jgi:hypothetical protein